MNLKRIFLVWALLMIILLAVYALFGPKSKSIDWNDITYKSTESADLFFKNMRSFSYNIENDEKSNWRLMRIKSRNQDSTKATLNFLIVNNWLQDENYIIIEPNKKLSVDGTISLKWENSEQEEEIILNEFNAEANYIFAARFYEQLTAESNFSFLNQKKEWEVLSLDEKDRKSLKKTLSDYFKLVGKIR